MVEKSWGTKRTCTCGRRFYDLNKKQIDCPECGEIVDINALRNIFAKNVLLKKKPQVIEDTKQTVDDKIPAAKSKEIEEDVEKETSIDIQGTDKISVNEIIGNKEGKNPKKIEEEEDKS